MSRILGIDFGERRIGLARSDPGGTVATPWGFVPDEKAFLEKVEEARADGGVEHLVLGLPKNMDGTFGPKAHQALSFKDRIERATGLRVETWDERLTTVQAERSLAQEGRTRKQRKAHVDERAAQILLQSYLDYRRRPGS